MRNNNIFKNIELFDLPINNDTFPILVEYTNDDHIYKCIEKNFNKICTDKININLIIGLILSNKKFNLLKKLFNIKPEIFNKEVYCKNIDNYIKYIKKPEIIADVYLHNINKYKKKITKSIAIFSLKFKNYKLVKKIIKKNNIFTIDLIKSNFFKHINYKNINNYNKIFEILKINIKDWNELYKINNICEIILKRNNLLYDDVILIYLNNKHLINKLFRTPIDNFTIEQKIYFLKMLLDNIENVYIDNFKISDIFNLLKNIEFDDFLIFDEQFNLSEKIKKYLDFEFLINHIFIELPELSFFKYINHFGYLIPNLYFNTLIIVNYIDQNTKIIEYYLSKCPFIREKTYNYLKDYITNNNVYSKKRRLINVLTNNSLLSMINQKNIITKSSNLYKNDLYEEIGEINYNLIKNVLSNVDWLYHNFNKNNDNDILSEL